MYYQTEKSKTNDASIIYTSLFASFGIQAAFVLLVILFNQYIPAKLLNDIDFFPYVFFTIIALPFNSIIEVAKTFYKSTHQGKKVFYRYFFLSINILLNLLFIVGLGFDVVGIFYGILINTLFFSIILYFSFYRKHKIQFEKGLLYKILRYCMPLVPYTALNILFEACDKFYLNSEHGSSISGIYYIVIIFASIFHLLKNQ